jgi:DNA ligase D-like protein (predicted 3'-phosphoesterase)
MSVTQVEDHQLDYYEFEGVIAAGYGEGTVLVWDKGAYRNLDEDRSMAEALDAGHAKVWLEGEKLTGGWTLQRTRGGSKPQWLMIKRRDEPPFPDRAAGIEASMTGEEGSRVGRGDSLGGRRAEQIE